MKVLNDPSCIYTINSRKFNGEIHRSWHAELLASNNDLFEFHGIFESDIDHPELGSIKKGTISYEFYWKHKGYNVFRFSEPNGNFRNFYCNIIVPPIFGDRMIDYVDLDIDVLVSKDFSVKILDRDEFETNSQMFGYTDEIRRGAENDLATVLDLIDRRVFPFDT